MNRDEIIRMAREAGYGLSLSDMHAHALERFASLVAAAEREACAEVCEERIGGAVQTNEWWSGFRAAMKSCAAAIRARGEK